MYVLIELADEDIEMMSETLQAFFECFTCLKEMVYQLGRKNCHPSSLYPTFLNNFFSDIEEDFCLDQNFASLYWAVRCIRLCYVWLQQHVCPKLKPASFPRESRW